MRKAGLASFRYSDLISEKIKNVDCTDRSPYCSDFVHQSYFFCDILITLDSEHAKGLRFPSDGLGTIYKTFNDLYPGLPIVYRALHSKVCIQIHVSGRPETDIVQSVSTFPCMTRVDKGT